jgi:hypothetical protein
MHATTPECTAHEVKQATAGAVAVKRELRRARGPRTAPCQVGPGRDERPHGSISRDRYHF